MSDTAALSSATVRELVATAQTGGPQAPEALNRLIEANEGLFRAVVRHFKPLSTTVDEDLLQVARIAFARAVGLYRSGAATFTTFAFKVMSDAVCKAIRRESRYEMHFPKAEYTDTIGRDTLSSQIDGWALKQELEALPAADKDLLKRLYAQRRSQTQIGADLGVSHTVISKRHRRILNNLRFAMTA